MSILETNTVDGIGISEDGFSAALLLADHLDWSDEYAHLVLLQDKLNAYFSFIESGQLKARLPRRRMKGCTIEIRFRCEPTEKAVQFLQAAQKQADKLKTKIRYQVMAET